MPRRQSFNLMEDRSGLSYSSEESFTIQNRRLPTNKRLIIGVVLTIVLIGLIALAIGLGIHFNSKTAEGEPPKEETSKVFGDEWMKESCDIPSTNQCPGSSIPLLLISLDGFRADYLERNITPVLDRLMKCGVRTPYMRSVYPTMTFPNHYTIVTGLYPESHGIVGNRMHDENIDEFFTIRSETKFDPVWWKGEPIWVTAKKQGKNTRAYFWVGSDVNISGIYPDEWYFYQTESYQPRVDRVLEWLSMTGPEKPDLMLTYFNEPDHVAHGSGPNDPKTNEILKKMDGYLGEIMDGLTSKGLHNCVNIIIVADHGMAETSCSREVNITYLTETGRFFTHGGTYGYINTHFKSDRSKYADEQSVSSVVEDLECKVDEVKVFTKETIPKRHHILNSNRIGNILLSVQDRWMLSMDRYSGCYLDGNHGYDNMYKSMEAMVVAYGPGFKHNFQSSPFENIELYNLMCNLLGITPAPNNGTHGALDDMLKNPPKSSSHPPFSAEECVPVNRVLNSNCGCTSQEIEVLGRSTSPVIVPPLQQPLVVLPISSSTCRIKTKDFDIYYSQSHSLPLWISYSLTVPNITAPRNVSKLITRAQGCVTDDDKSTSPTSAIWCQPNSTGFIPGYMFEPYLSSSQETMIKTYQITNIVPMYPGFRNGIWNAVQELIVDYSYRYNGVSVVSGLIWDKNIDGHADQMKDYQTFVNGEKTVAVPTHYFVVITRCSNASSATCDKGGVDVISIVLPHKNKIPNCMAPMAYLQDNVVRVRDVELLTGLQFFTEIEAKRAARLRTYLAVCLWPTNIVDKTDTWLDSVTDSCSSKAGSKCPDGTPPLILIGLDGFGADLVKLNVTPNVNRLRECGVHSPFMRPVYPTLTFPNLYSIVTGLYPESHGIVSNNMYDSKLKTNFNIRKSGTSDPAWWGGEPIWNTAMKQGKTAASFFWVGSERKVQGMQPNITISPYSSSFPYQERISTVLKWLDLPQADRPDFITLYFDKPDYTIHREGKSSEVTLEILAYVDRMIGKLMTGLKERGMANCVNIIIVADHGMLNTSCDRQVKLDEFLSKSELKKVFVYDGPDGQIDMDYRGTSYTKNDPPASEETYLEKLQCKDPHVRVMKKTMAPVRLHYANNDRIPEILISSDPGWIVSRKGYRFCNGGNHGWDNLDVHLGSLFLGYGPSFKRGLEIESFENIELYNLMADLLEIDPAPNNGTHGSLYKVLKTPQNVSATDVQPVQRMCTATYPQNVTSLFINCSCSLDQADVALYENLINSTVSLPLGNETSASSFSDECLLQQQSFISSYNTDLLFPSWINVPLPPNLGEIKSVTEKPSCIFYDPRIPPLPASSDCQSNSDLLLAPLIPEEIMGNYSHLSSNMIQMYQGFRESVWKEVWSSVKAFSSIPGTRMTIGPVFDYNHDGLADSPDAIRNQTVAKGMSLPLPSHFYVSLLRCEMTNSEGCSKFGILSYVVPHVASFPSCWNMTEYLASNVVRVRDIELLTGAQTLTSDHLLTLRLHLPLQ